MMKRILATITFVLLLAGGALADTLYLKNGSILKGTFVGFENGEFVFEVTNGNRLKIRPAEITRLVMERGDAGTSPVSPPASPVPRDARSDRYPTRIPNNPPSNVPDRSAPSGRATWENLAPFDVALESQWIRSQIRVERGQRVRVDASGTIYLEGRTAVTPDGLNRRDRDAPMPEQNDGGLLAAIGQEQDSPPIFMGHTREFTADRAGILYFTVNHWETRDARGSFRVNVAVERSADFAASNRNTGAARVTQTMNGHLKAKHKASLKAGHRIERRPLRFMLIKPGPTPALIWSLTLPWRLPLRAKSDLAAGEPPTPAAEQRATLARAVTLFLTLARVP